MAQVASVTNLPVTTVILTDSDLDHSYKGWQVSRRV